MTTKNKKNYFLISLLIYTQAHAEAPCTMKDMLTELKVPKFDQFKSQMCKNYFTSMYAPEQAKVSSMCSDLINNCQKTLMPSSDPNYVKLLQWGNAAIAEMQIRDFDERYGDQLQQLEFYESAKSYFTESELKGVFKCKDIAPIKPLSECLMHDTFQGTEKKASVEALIEKTRQEAGIEKQLELEKELKKKAMLTTYYGNKPDALVAEPLPIGTIISSGNDVIRRAAPQVKVFLSGLPSSKYGFQDSVLAKLLSDNAKPQTSDEIDVEAFFQRFGPADIVSTLGADTDKIIYNWWRLRERQGASEDSNKLFLKKFFKENGVTRNNLNQEAAKTLKKIRLEMVKEVAADACSSQSVKSRREITQFGGTCKALTYFKMKGELKILPFDKIKVKPIGDTKFSEYEYNMITSRILCSTRFPSLDKRIGENIKDQVKNTKNPSVLDHVRENLNKEIAEAVASQSLSGEGQEKYGVTNWSNIKNRVGVSTQDSNLVKTTEDSFIPPSNSNRGSTAVNNMVDSTNNPESAVSSDSSVKKPSTATSDSTTTPTKTNTVNPSSTSGATSATTNPTAATAVTSPGTLTATTGPINPNTPATTASNTGSTSLLPVVNPSNGNQGIQTTDEESKKSDETLADSSSDSPSQDAQSRVKVGTKADSALSALAAENKKLRKEIADKKNQADKLATSGNGSGTYIPRNQDAPKADSTQNSPSTGLTTTAEQSNRAETQAIRDVNFNQPKTTEMPSYNSPTYSPTVANSPVTPSTQTSVAAKSSSSKSSSAVSTSSGILLTQSLESTQDVAQIISDPKESELVAIADKTSGQPFIIKENGELFKIVPKLDKKGKVVFIDNKMSFEKVKLTEEQKKSIVEQKNKLRSAKEIERDPTRKFELDRALKDSLK